MRQFCAVANVGVFHFHVVTHFYVVANDRTGTEMDERADFAAILDFTIVGIGKLQMVVIAHVDIGHADVRPDLAVFANDRLPFEDRSRIEHRIAADDDRRIDIGVGRIDDRDSSGHQFYQFALAQYLFGFSQLQARVDAQCFLICGDSIGADHLTGSDEHADNIRQIIFALRIVIADLMQHGP